MTLTGIASALNNRGEKLIFKNCAPFTDCINKIKNTEIHHGKDIGVVMPMDNLTEYSEKLSKTFEILWQYYSNEPIINDEGNNGDFLDDKWCII